MTTSWVSRPSRPASRCASGSGASAVRLWAIGPMISGPHQTPYVCTTATFTLPDASSLSAPIDDNCSVQTRVDYIYHTNTTPASFKPLPVLSDVSCVVVSAKVCCVVSAPI